MSAGIRDIMAASSLPVLVDCDDGDLGTVTMQNVAPRLSHTPGRIRHTGKTEIGADRDEILSEVLGRIAARPTEGAA